MRALTRQQFLANLFSDKERLGQWLNDACVHDRVVTAEASPEVALGVQVKIDLATFAANVIGIALALGYGGEIEPAEIDAALTVVQRRDLDNLLGDLDLSGLDEGAEA